ncbi:MAG: ATP-binding protein [Elusimicrobiota bacterium]
MNRLLLVLFGAGLIPIVPAGFFLFYYQSQSKTNITALEQSVSQMAALMTERETQDLSRRLERMWAPGTKYVDPANLERALRANPEFLYMAFTGADGREILSGGAPELRRFFGFLDIGDTRLFRTAAEGGRISIGQFEMLYDMPLCRMVYPLGGGYFAFAAVNLRDLVEKLHSQRLGATGGLLLADAEGGSLAFSRSLEKFDRQAVRSMTALGPVFEFEGARGVYVGAAARVRGFDLYAVALEERAEAFSGINRIIWLMAFLLLGVATAFYFSALAFTRSLAAPVGALLAGAARVSGGDFRTAVAGGAQFSELSELITAFNSMMREVERYHGIQVEKVFEEKQKLELLVSLIHDAIILCDFRGELLYANAAAEVLLGVNEPQAPKGPTLRRKVADLVYLKSEAGDGVIGYDTPAGKKYFQVNLQTLAAKTQRPAVFMVLRDVTLEREVQKVKEEFFHSVAHDLRAPLLTMQGYINLLEREFAPGAKQAGYVNSVRASSDRLFKMLENILDISRMEAGHLKPDLRKLNAAEFLAASAESFRALFEEKGVALNVDAAGAGAAEFSADSALLRRVMENLLSNAWKFTPPGGSVTASARAENGGVVFTVADTGPGIPPDQLEAVFERYKRLKTGEGETGFGLGLAIARKIVQLHGGQIWAEGGPGGVFKFSVK